MTGYFRSMVKNQIRQLLAHEPGLQKNTNALILEVWKLNGLKMKNKQNIPVYMLPEATDILSIAEKIDINAPHPKPKKDVDGMKYEVIEPHKANKDGKHK